MFDLIENIKEFKKISLQIKTLTQDKTLLEMLIAEDLKHGDDLSKTYTCANHKVTVTSGYNYKIDKKLLKEYKEYLTINPFVEKQEIKLDKAKLKEALEYGDEKNTGALNEILTATPSKIHVKVGDL